MAQIYVHDFFIDPLHIGNMNGENDFCYSIDVYFNFSLKDPGDEWKNLEYFNITVANPNGLAKHLLKCIELKIYPNIFFFSRLLISIRNDRKEIKQFIQRELEAIDGKTEKEILLKAAEKFEWQGEVPRSP